MTDDRTPPYATGDRVEVHLNVSDPQGGWYPGTVTQCVPGWLGPPDGWDLYITVNNPPVGTQPGVVLWLEADGSTGDLDLVRRMAAVTVDPSTIAAGQIPDIYGTGFPTDQTVTLELYPGTSGGTLTAGPREPRVVTTVPGHTVDDVPITVTEAE